jgi:hypothetical protein
MLGVTGEMKEGLAKVADWLAKPTGEIPKSEALEVLRPWRGRLEQVGFGARRARCDWAYTLPEEREDAIAILLPDAQEVRGFSRLLALRARLEIAEGKFGEAEQTLRTGLGLARHAAEGPFLISKLIGIAIANEMLGVVEEWMGQPGSPNLYWSLTMLPRPVVGLYEGIEYEERLIRNLLPELAGPDYGMEAKEQWAASVARLLGQLKRLAARTEEFGMGEAHRKAFEGLTVERFREVMSERLSAEERAGRSDDEAIMKSIRRMAADRVGSRTRVAYLPVDERNRMRSKPDQAVKKEGSGGFTAGSVAALVDELQPGSEAASVAEARLGRRVAALRVIEAIRMQAAANGGKMPGSLEEIRIVPVPVDPVTLKGFLYALEGGAATLKADPELQPTVPNYRLTIRK